VPWKEQRIVDNREAFVRALLSERATMTELCREFRISRKTGYKWAQRFFDGGTPNLVDRATVAKSLPHALAPQVVEAVLSLRRRYPTWGPKKLQAVMIREHPELKVPARSTVAALLQRNGLITSRNPRRRTPAATQPLAAATGANVIWCTDFKGKFKVDRRYCHPLTISDAYSRYLLRCSPLDGEHLQASKAVFEGAFREFGLPLRMRSDNGTPFASSAVGGLSRLSIWWIKLGITPERIKPGHPQENGRHERMHRTLKAEVASPPRSVWEEQVDALEAFRKTFNDVRPHEALQQETPSSRYVASPRAFPEHVGDPDYPDHFEVRRIKKNGCATFNYADVIVGAVLANECVGLEPIDDGLWHAWFGPIFLGKLRILGKRKCHFAKNVPE
jgi:putative transposase